MRAKDLHPRERQIMDVLHRGGAASVAEVREGLADPPSYSAVRAMLGKLEAKGHVSHARDGMRYVYRATEARETARETALGRLLRTFFDGSPAQAVAAILDRSAGDLSEAELDDLAGMIEQARRKGR
jgi:predicted transcriptional regulator